MFYESFTNMATTLKEVILKHQKRSDKTWNVKIRVTHERQSAYIPTEHYLIAKQISSDFKRIKDEFIADEVRKDIARLRIEISKLGGNISKYTAKSLAEYLSRKRRHEGEKGLFVFPFIDKVNDGLKEDGRTSVASGNSALKNNLKEWLKRDNLEFKEITVKFLREFEAFLVKKIGSGTRGVESNLGYLRTIFNLARVEFNDEDLEDIKIPGNPFERYKIPKSKEPEKRAIPVEILLKIRDYKYIPRGKFEHKKEISRPELARDVFMLSFYLCGMNSKDIFLLRADQIQADRITYNRAKTKDRREDQAKTSIRIEEEALELFVKYKDPAGIRAFNFYHRYTDERTFNSNLNKGLKYISEKIKEELEKERPGENIDVDIDFYSARHTWATIARVNCGVIEDDISFALVHSDSVKGVTGKYITKDFSLIDRANEKVLAFVRTYKGSKSEELNKFITSLVHVR